MKSKTATQICSIAMFCSFFFPLFRWHGFEMSGLNYILSDHIPSYKYFLLTIPFSAVFLFWGAVDGKYVFGRKILSWLSLVSLILISIARITDASDKRDFYDNENPFFTIDLGFWLLLFFSLVLVLVKNEKKEIFQSFIE
jgi:hypothetical protein